MARRRVAEVCGDVDVSQGRRFDEFAGGGVVLGLECPAVLGLVVGDSVDAIESVDQKPRRVILGDLPSTVVETRRPFEVSHDPIGEQRVG